MLELNDAVLESVTGGWGHSGNTYKVTIQLQKFTVKDNGSINIAVSF